MSFEIIIEEHAGPLPNSAPLLLPTAIDMPPEDPRSLLYILDSQLERLEIEAFEQEIAKAQQVQEQTQAKAKVKAQRQAIAELPLLQEMLENELLLDALGRRTLAVAGFETAPVFHDPFYWYLRKEQSTSYAPPSLNNQVLIIGAYDNDQATFSDAQHSNQTRSLTHLERPAEHYWEPRAPYQHHHHRHLRPACFAHEPEPAHVRDRYEEHALDWLGRELLRARNARARSASDTHQDEQNTAVTKGGGNEGEGFVYVIDDGSVGNTQSVAESSTAHSPPHANVARSDYPRHLPVHDNYDQEAHGDAPTASSASTNVTSSTAPAAESAALADDTKAPTSVPTRTRKLMGSVMDEKEEAVLETTGVPVATEAVVSADSDGPPRKTLKVHDRRT
ncbi:hypothetical protein K437DRAFT_276204 [Tilletiaria anomala UBC 951]|uniref:Uncharacterized protein n=1 Tax=Tilletiaria anomala (strain ATCC 24038 / CBS 436.72 / UBC 951) TaxID=1037660 RepID=A0A066VAC5_TILAU|nr:uncharacterized protein K437DRAFT_276204 [Tilletiaria anomala UBC 951]KDN38702.1 hypothetical protein K437DRAFT_276204 [Tilletiaria anomala UBC 951]